MNKKVIAVGAVLVGAAIVFWPKKTSAQTPTQIGTVKTGYNSDGSVRQLTDAEAQLYLDKNPDLIQAYNINDNNQQSYGSMIAFAKHHWFDWAGIQEPWRFN